MKLGLLDALGEKMRWHQQRQTLLAENVANADTPGYRGRDLKAFGFEEHMRNVSSVKVATVATRPGHFNVQVASSNDFGAREMNGIEIRPAGNGVTLEDEMMKVAGNQMDYQAITSLYTRSMKLIKTALGRQA